MKKTFISLILSIFITNISLAFSSIPLFAAAVDTNLANKIEIVVNPTAVVGEAIDLTIKILDEAGNVKKDYEGTIFISIAADPDAKVPYSTEEGYTFKTADQ